LFLSLPFPLFHSNSAPFLSACIFEWDAGDVCRLLEAKRSELEGKHGMVVLTEASRKIVRKEIALHCRESYALGCGERNPH
jgi:hypothetical protein